MTGSGCAITGVGYSPFTRGTDRTILDLAAQACQAAIDDAGLTNDEVNGVGSFMLMNDSVLCQSVATSLALPAQGALIDLQLGGQAPCYLVGLAVAAIEAGMADNMVLFRALRGRSGRRVGTMRFPGAGAQYRYPIGYDAYMMYVAMWARRFLYETGQGADDLAAVALAQRAYATQNARAVRSTPLTRDEYFAAPYIVEPFRPADCTVEVDGACAVVVSRLDRARDLAHPPAVISSTAYRAGRRSGLDIGDHILWEDYTRNYTSQLADGLFGAAGITPGDVTMAEIYDCFTSTVLIGLEGLGLCGRGGSGELVRSGGTGIDGRLPTNTHGGLLAEGYLHGMNTVAEAALQVQRRGGDRQAPRSEVCVVTSGAMMDGSAMVLTSDR